VGSTTTGQFPNHGDPTSERHTESSPLRADRPVESDCHRHHQQRMLLVWEIILTRRTEAPRGDRLVWRRGKAIDRTIPDYAQLAQLDDLINQ